MQKYIISVSCPLNIEGVDTKFPFDDGVLEIRDVFRYDIINFSVTNDSSSLTLRCDRLPNDEFTLELQGDQKDQSLQLIASLKEKHNEDAIVTVVPKP